MASCPGTYYIVVLEENHTKEIVGGATFFMERKFIHYCSKRGHIDDVVVDEKFRGRNLGRILMECLVRLGKHLGCIKISLDCTDEQIGFYRKFGFECEYNIMYRRFNEKGYYNPTQDQTNIEETS